MKASQGSRVSAIGGLARWVSGMLAVAAMAATGLIACTALVDHGAKQCTSDADCMRLSSVNGICDKSAGVCIFQTGVTGSNPDGGSADATPDVPMCITAGPSTRPEDLGKTCTDAECTPFDNCAHGLCDNPDAALLAPADAGTAVGSPPTDAGTPVSCANDTDRQNVIYMTGSSNFPPLLAQLGPLIFGKTGYTLVYQVTSSCNGVKTIFSAAAKDHLMVDPGPSVKVASATYVASDGKLVPCLLGSGGVTVDMGESDIFSSSCTGFDEPALTGNVGQYFGPVQAMVFVVPNQSNQVAISAEMARAVFGRGGDGGKAAPWTNPQLYFIRNANTGTQQMIGRAIGVSADQFWGVDRGTAANVAVLLKGVQQSLADQAIGIISSDVYDHSDNIRELAYQAPGQTCGYWPDSTKFLKDKRNVRDGHYPIWGYLHFFAITSGGIATSPAAQALTEQILLEDPGIEILNAYIDAGLVPSCAMQVQRARDLGQLTASPPGVSCGCYFEARLSGGVAPDGCKPCTTPNECAGTGRPACSFGYCEAG
jgi:hypothetical protein